MTIEAGSHSHPPSEGIVPSEGIKIEDLPSELIREIDRMARTYMLRNVIN